VRRHPFPAHPAIGRTDCDGAGDQAVMTTSVGGLSLTLPETKVPF
jgi:hypothetical protein